MEEPLTINGILLGLTIGAFGSILAWFILTHLIRPWIQFSHAISKKRTNIFLMVTRIE